MNNYEYTKRGRGAVYLKSFNLPDDDMEWQFWNSGSEKSLLNCYGSRYPFGVFRGRELPCFEFAPVTIFYGGNGSGKSTLLNIIAEKLRLKRGTVYNRSDFFEDFTDMCRCKADEIPQESKIVTSDDVFDYLLSVREKNNSIDSSRNELLEEYTRLKHSSFQLGSLEDIDRLKSHNDAKRKTKSRFVRERLEQELSERSNGESALKFFADEVREDALYLLDEPENSLSSKLQLELAEFLEASAQFFNCQLVISTHSPFLLAMRGARIYDLDANPVAEQEWSRLENMKIFYDFFKLHSREFEKE